MFDQKTANAMTEAEALRLEVNRYRAAALIAYGALLAKPDSNREVIGHVELDGPNSKGVR